jgi:hypothetical protein
MRVKPAAGRNVRDPITKRHLPTDGADVPESTYWIRRLRDGDVIPCPAPDFSAPQVDPIPDSVVTVVPDSSQGEG